MTRICTVAGCHRPGRRRGLCAGHHARLRRLGDVLADVPIGELPRKEYADPLGEADYTALRAAVAADAAKLVPVALAWVSREAVQQL